MYSIFVSYPDVLVLVGTLLPGIIGFLAGVISLRSPWVINLLIVSLKAPKTQGLCLNISFILLLFIIKS